MANLKRRPCCYLIERSSLQRGLRHLHSSLGMLAPCCTQRITGAIKIAISTLLSKEPIHMTTSTSTPALLPAVEKFLAAPKRLLIGGEWVQAASDKTFTSFNPSTGEPLIEVAEADSADIDRAVAAAREAYTSVWRSTPPAQRAQMLWKLADLIEQRADEFAQLEALDMGKTQRIARAADVPLVVDHLRYYAGWCTKIHGETLPAGNAAAPAQRFFTYTLREPVGVVGSIIPWNFPLLMTAWKLAPALACGNTIVLKPAEQTPL